MQLYVCLTPTSNNKMVFPEASDDPVLLFQGLRTQIHRLAHGMYCGKILWALIFLPFTLFLVVIHILIEMDASAF